MRSTAVRATDDYLWWASSHCTRTSATTEGGLPCTWGPAQLKPAQRYDFHAVLGHREAVYLVPLPLLHRCPFLFSLFQISNSHISAMRTGEPAFSVREIRQPPDTVFMRYAYQMRSRTTVMRPRGERLRCMMAGCKHCPQSARCAL